MLLLSLTWTDLHKQTSILLLHKHSNTDNNARHWVISNPESFLSFEYCKKLHASKVSPRFHTPSDTVCSLLEACHRGERTLVLTSLIWLNECFAPCGECTFLLKIIMGRVTDRDPFTFFIPFHFWAQGRIICQSQWQMGPQQAAFPQSYATNYSELCCVSEPSWWWPDETGSKQTESWKGGKPFPQHYEGA